MHHGTSLVCHKLSSDSWQILDQEMTGVLDHHRQCCALTQAYKEASGWMCVLPSLEWVVAELCLLPTPSSSHSSLNTGQKCSGGGREILSAVSPAVWCWQDSWVELRRGMWLTPALLLPVHGAPPGSQGAAGGAELSAASSRRKHRAAVREPLWDWDCPVLAGSWLVGRATTCFGGDGVGLLDQCC